MPCTMSFIHFYKEHWNELERGEGLLEAYISPQIIEKNNEKN